MQFYEAKAADIVRSSQRDETFVNELQDYLTSVIKLCSRRNYHHLMKIIKPLTTTWYYLLTSLSSLQTLGEEYTGTLRLSTSEKIPQRNLQLLWLILYVGGDAVYETALNSLEDRISNSKELRTEVKRKTIKLIKFLRGNKDLLIRLHHSIFYIGGKYYNVSNRITGIKYVLVRQWLQDDAATQSFNILGKVMLLYLLFSLIRNFLTENDSISTVGKSTSRSGKICTLCVEDRKNTCATTCGHLFCWECIYDSLKYQQACPICRQVVNPSRIIFLQNYT